jgi:hypothetical protein
MVDLLVQGTFAREPPEFEPQRARRLEMLFFQVFVLFLAFAVQNGWPTFRKLGWRGGPLEDRPKKE